MKIIDKDSNKSIDRVILFLNISEAKQMHSYLEDILNNNTIDHVHIETDDLVNEITLCVRDEK